MFARDGGRNSSKKRQKQIERGALMVRITFQEENSIKFLIAYFHLRFSIT